MRLLLQIQSVFYPKRQYGVVKREMNLETEYEAQAGGVEQSGLQKNSDHKPNLSSVTYQTCELGHIPKFCEF